MRSHLNNIFEEILEEVNSFDPDKPYWLFEILIWNLTEEEKSMEKEYLPRIHEAVAKKDDLKKDYVLEYIDQLPNFYMLGITPREKSEVPKKNYDIELENTFGTITFSIKNQNK